MTIELKAEYFVKVYDGPRMGQKDEKFNTPIIEHSFEYVEDVTGLEYDGTGHIDDIPFHFYLVPGTTWVMLTASRQMWLEDQICELFPDDCNDVLNESEFEGDIDEHDDSDFDY